MPRIVGTDPGGEAKPMYRIPAGTPMRRSEGVSSYGDVIWESFVSTREVRYALADVVISGTYLNKMNKVTTHIIFCLPERAAPYWRLSVETKYIETIL
jgi:hypothetical protein